MARKKPAPPGKAPEELLAQLHGAVASALIDRVEDAEATASDFQAAIKFLKDNNITVDGRKSPKMTELEESMAGLPDIEDLDDLGASLQ